jgi:hypothetical protein
MAKLTIEDLLNSLKGDNNKTTNRLSPREIWDMVANKDSFDKIGFSSEDELKEYLKNNPYNNL